MKAYRLLSAIAVGFFVLTASAALAQRADQNRQDQTQFNEHDQQVAHDWYNQNQAHPPAGFRNQDRLSPDEESRLHESAVLDKNLRKKVHPPPSNHRYVAIGGHVGLIDNHLVKAVIHLHDNH